MKMKKNKHIKVAPEYMSHQAARVLNIQYTVIKHRNKYVISVFPEYVISGNTDIKIPGRTSL